MLKICPGQSGTAGAHLGIPLAGRAAVVVKWRAHNITFLSHLLYLMHVASPCGKDAQVSACFHLAI